MAKSILHDKREGTCYLCKLLNNDYQRRNNLEEHHVMEGTANRKKSEHWGLKVYLCHEHHQGSPAAVHRNKDTEQTLKVLAQMKFESLYSHKLWMEEFGKNYL